MIEAEQLNRKLQYVNCHQTCLIDDYKHELAQLQQDLMKTKVKLDQQPTIIHSQQLEERQKIKVLEDALNSVRYIFYFVTVIHINNYADLRYLYFISKKIYPVFASAQVYLKC